MIHWSNKCVKDTRDLLEICQDLNRENSELIKINSREEYEHGITKAQLKNEMSLRECAEKMRMADQEQLLSLTIRIDEIVVDLHHSDKALEDQFKENSMLHSRIADLEEEISTMHYADKCNNLIDVDRKATVIKKWNKKRK